MRAAPVVKPLITGRDTYWIRWPKLSSDSAVSIAPTHRAACAPTCTDSGDPGVAWKSFTSVPVSRDASATGPTDSCMDDPRSAYTGPASRNVYRPFTGGRFARDAYDSACEKEKDTGQDDCDN